MIDINFGSATEDWLHINSVRYNSDRDEILVSVHNLSEIWIIDHSTTTAQAASHTGGNSGKGGDLIYRWGNPQAYDAGTSADQKLFAQHDARWIDSGLPGEGNILIFNNGQGRTGGNYSSVDEISLPTDSNGNYYLNGSGSYGPDTLTWTYEAQPASSFYAQNISGVTRQPNGNTLICQGPSGNFIEVDSAGNIVWQYINPVTMSGILSQGDNPSNNPVFKIYRYSPRYSGLAGKDLSQKGKIETYTTGVENNTSSPLKFKLAQNFPNPFNPSTSIQFEIPVSGFVTLKIYDITGREIDTLINEFKETGNYVISYNATDIPSGVYFYQITSGTYSKALKMICLK